MPVLSASITDLDEERFPASGQSCEAQLASGAQQRRQEERAHALRLLDNSGREPSITLPILATAGDVREVVQYLRKKPTGVSVVEALGDVKKRVFEPRKIAAYEFWGIVNRRTGDRLQLTQLGWEFARKLAPETEAYRAVLDHTAPYRAALDWMWSEQLDLVTHKDVSAYWQQFYDTGPGQNQKTVEAGVVCFFHLCQAAEIGTTTIGKRGQPARLRVEREELNAFIEGRLTTQRVAPDPLEVALSNCAFPSEKLAALTADPTQNIRFLLTCSAATKTVSRLRATLELMDIETRTVVVNEADALPCAEDTCAAMRQCAAGMIVVTPEACHLDETGAYILNQPLLQLINTAFVLYDRRVVLLWDKQIPFPVKLSSLPNFSLEGDELTWDVGVQLMRVIKDFQAHARADISRAG